MNKLKVAIQELRDHLGRDAVGLRLLDQITEIANEQRKRLAAIEPATQQVQATASKLRSDLDAAKSRIDVLLAARDREIARRESAESRVRSLTEKLSPPEEPAETSPREGEVFVRRVERLVKLVTNKRKHIPGSGGDGSCVIAEDFVKGFTNSEFMDLGMVMALCAFVNIPMHIKAYHTLRDEKIPQDRREEMAAKFFYWFRNRIAVNKVEDRVYRETRHDPVPPPGFACK